MSYCSAPTWKFLNYIDENKFFTCITSITFGVIGIFLYILTAYTFFDKQKIPRAIRPSAPFGNIKNILSKDTTLYIFLWKYYNKFKRKKCKIGGFYIFFKPAIIIIDPIFINRVLTNKDFLNLYKYNKAGILRKFVDILDEDTADIIIKNCNSVNKKLLKHIEENNSTFSIVLRNCLMDSTCLTFGLQQNSSIQNFLTTIESIKFASNFNYHFNLVYPYFSRNLNGKKWKLLLESIILHRKKIDLKERDILQKIIDLLNEDSDGNSREIFDILLNTFVENIVYAHSTILLCLYELSQSFEIQEEVIGEVRRSNKENESLNIKILGKLPYLDAVIKETLRKYPPVPIIIKKCNKQFQFDLNSKLPKGSLLFVPSFGIHHDPLNYPNPENFDPDRFLEDTFKPETFLPFGYDIQKKIGFQFTCVYVKMILISIFSNFKVTLDKNYSIEFDKTRLNVHPTEPLLFRFESL